MKHIKVGVIGVGRMGQNHCRVYSSLRQADFVGVYDLNISTASKVAQRYEVTAFKTIDDLLDQVEAVSITTTTPAHFDLVMRCLQRGIHVLVEKPLTETCEQALILCQSAESNWPVVQVGHIERFNPVYLELKNVLEHMAPLVINFNRLSPYKGSNIDVDVILDLMTHDLDLILDLAHEEPKQIHAAGLKIFSNCLDHVVVQFVFPGIPIVTSTASRITEQKIRCIDVTTRDAYIEGDLLNKTILIHRRTTGEYLNQNTSGVKYRHESLVERILVPNVEPLFSEIQHFLECVVEQKTPKVTLQDGYRALCLAMKIREKVSLSEAYPIGNMIPD